MSGVVAVPDHHDESSNDAVQRPVDRDKSSTVAVATITGETPAQDRKRLLEAFRAGKIQVLTNVYVLSEGTDLPEASCVVHTRPTKSSLVYIQTTGRVLRIAPGKENAIILETIGNIRAVSRLG